MQQALSPAKHRNSTAEELNSNQNGSPRDPHWHPNGAWEKTKNCPYTIQIAQQTHKKSPKTETTQSFNQITLF